jgi:hypothetical protein
MHRFLQLVVVGALAGCAVACGGDTAGSTQSASTSTSTGRAAAGSTGSTAASTTAAGASGSTAASSTTAGSSGSTTASSTTTGSNGSSGSTAASSTTGSASSSSAGSTSGSTGQTGSCANLPTTSLNGQTVPRLDVGAGQPFAKPADALACVPVTPGAAAPFVMNLAAGTYLPFGIFAGHDGFQLTGAGAGQTIIDGQGGCNSSNNSSGGSCTTRLIYGKGAIYTQSAGTISDLQVTNAGNNAGGHGDGQAGIYAEGFTGAGTLTLQRIYVFNNQNGFFVPSGASVQLLVDSCDFVDNGQGGGGYSHDMYTSGMSTTVQHSNFYGNPFGNNIKSRSPVVSITGGYNASNAGRTVNFPEGGQVTITGGLYTSVAGANSNFASYADENTNQGVSHVSWSSSAIIFSRYNSTFLLPNGGSFDFSNISEQFANPSGNAPSVAVSGSGTLNGLPATSLPATDSYVALPNPPAHVSGAP